MRIVFVDIDTLRPDHLGCYGYNRNTSPNMDKIAEEGSIFTETYASDAPCLPSRASLFTGRFGIHSGIVGHGGTAADLMLTGRDRGFQDRNKTQMWVPLLKRAGYYTASISPFAERHSAYWFYSGWDEMYNPGKGGMEIADDIFLFADKWLKDNGKQRNNWFLHLNIWDPHTPYYRMAPSYGNQFKNEPPPSWMTEEIIQNQRKSYGPHSACEPWGDDDMIIPQDLRKDYPIGEISEIHNLKDFKTWIDGYDTGIKYADDFVGKIVSLLKKYEIYDDTLIVISSDHGECQGELNIYGDHGTACHITNRVPMIVKWPDKTKNWKKTYDSFIYTNDMAATLLESVNATVPESWDGASFYKRIEVGEDFSRNYLVISQNAWSCQRTVRFDNWTLIKTYHTGLKNFPDIMLYDYEKDFHMLNNLTDEKPDIVSQGLEYLDKWYAEMMKNSSNNIDPMDTVIKEGGPFHTRDILKEYLLRLMKSGRQDMVEVILNRNESYLDEVTIEEITHEFQNLSRLSVMSTLGEILNDKQGRSVMEKHFGAFIFKSPLLRMGMGVKLITFGKYMPKLYTKEKLSEIDEDLKKIE